MQQVPTEQAQFSAPHLDLSHLVRLAASRTDQGGYEENQDLLWLYQKLCWTEGLVSGP